MSTFGGTGGGGAMMARSQGRGILPLELRLYIAASAPNSQRAESNLRELLSRAGIEEFSLEIIDCIRDPLRALGDGVVVTPTLIKASPEPARSIVGTLSDARKVASALGIADRLTGLEEDERR